jgi:hypothetical protein
MMDMYGKKTGKKSVAKKGMHRMPDGTMMKNSAMKKQTKKMGEVTMENYEEDITKYPSPDKQYEAAMKYCTYESIQTGAMGKAAK